MNIIKKMAAAAAMMAATMIANTDAVAQQADAAPRAIVIYFSHAGDNYKVGEIEEGNTKVMADYIVEATGADRFEVVAQKNYDMSSKALTAVARKEQQNGELPPYKGKPEDLSKYDIVFVGSPVWCGTWPQVMFSFFRDNDLNGKIIIPFTTHEGSRMGRCQTDIAEAYPDAIVIRGLAVYGHKVRNAKDQVTKWATESMKTKLNEEKK